MNYIADFLHRLMFGQKPKARYVDEPRPGPQPLVNDPKEAMAIFTRRMWREFNFASRPAGWKDEKPNDVFVAMTWTICKLGHAVRGNRPDAVAEHAADLANLAMILTDVSGALREKEDEAA